MQPKKTLAGAMVAALGLTAASSASSAIIGDAANYNVFIFGSGSFTSQNSDTMGNLAAGGNVSLMNYSVASTITGVPTAMPDPARLVVGGTLTAQNGGVGSNQAGAIYTNSTPSLTSFSATGGVHAQTVVSSFSADQTLYTNLSSNLASLATNGTTSGLLAGGTLDFTGTSSGLNVFTVSATTLSASDSINIVAPTGSTVLINVTGNGTVTFANGSVSESGVSAANVLYNIASGAVTLGSKNPEGSILAPNAGVTGSNGALTGQLIADSYSGTTEFNQALFTGNLTTVPLPASTWLMLSGIAGMGLLARRRRILTHVHGIEDFSVTLGGQPPAAP